MPKPTYQIATLSASTNFAPINITATTAGTANMVHDSSSAANTYDEIWLDAYNYSASDAILTICFGGTATHQQMSIPIPTGRGLIPIIKGLRFTGSVDVTAYASVANSIAVIGSINRIVFI